MVDPSLLNVSVGTNPLLGRLRLPARGDKSRGLMQVVTSITDSRLYDSCEILAITESYGAVPPSPCGYVAPGITVIDLD